MVFFIPSLSAMILLSGVNKIIPRDEIVMVDSINVGATLGNDLIINGMVAAVAPDETTKIFNKRIANLLQMLSTLLLLIVLTSLLMHNF